MKIDVISQSGHLLLPIGGAQVTEFGRSPFLLLSRLFTHLQKLWKIFLDSAASSPPSRAYAHAPRTPAGAGADTLQSLLLSGVGARLGRALLPSWDDREVSEPL